MSPLDMSVLFFFALAAFKAFMDSLDYWRDRDDEAAMDYMIDQINKARSRRRAANARPAVIPYKTVRADISIRSAVRTPSTKILQEQEGVRRQTERAA